MTCATSPGVCAIIKISLSVAIHAKSARMALPLAGPNDELGLNCNLFNADFPASFLKAWRPARLLMPTYDYSCQKCGQTFEAFQSMRDEPFRECPKELCRLPKWGHGKVKRLLGTGAGLIFKGSGFYSTDYRSESYKAAAKKESTPKASESGDKSSKTEPAKTSSSGETKAAEKKSGKESA
jgi:putative FmdB family regulatory protein